MFFSISMPVYNASKYIDRAIQSVVSQTENDFELILVDDGSSDDSLEKCKKWQSRYPDRIRVIEKKNTGSLLTRRRCMIESKGDYLYIMDADDCLLSNRMLEELKSKIMSSGCDMVFFNATTHMKERRKLFQFPFKDNELFYGNDLTKLYKYLFYGQGLNPLWNKIFSRQIVDWDTDYSTYDYITNATDLFQSLAIICNSKKALYVESIYYYYQIDDNEGSIVHKFNKSYFKSALAHCERLRDFSKSWIIEDVDIEQLFKRRYMLIASTAVYKARLITKNDNTNIYSYIKEIGQNPIIEENYCLKGLPISRCFIVWCLHHRLYFSLSAIIKIGKKFSK